MKLGHQITGQYLIVVALAVSTQFILETTYESASITPKQVWLTLDWFSLAGFMLCCGFNLAYMRGCVRGDADVWKKFSSSTAFYASVILTLAFVHNFVASLAAGSDDLLFWKFINATQVPLFFATGMRLLGSHRD
ncbi:MAG: hypothetical protein OXC42_08265 [Gammaproteobacteria bacterium]|nr:hypothetical protein [Gammaproteobacteria bacterium]